MSNKFNSTEERVGNKLKLNFGNSSVYTPETHFQSEEVDGLIIESYQDSARELLEALNFDTKKYSLEYLMEQTGLKREGVSLIEEATVEVPVNTTADVKSDGEKVVIEIDLKDGKLAEFDEAGAVAGESVMSESFRNIHGILLPETQLPEAIEASLLAENGKIFVELPISVNGESLDESQIASLNEQVSILSNLFNKGLKFEHLYTKEDFLQDKFLAESFILMDDSEAEELVSNLGDGARSILKGLMEQYSLPELALLLEATPPAPSPAPLPKSNIYDYIRAHAGRMIKDPIRQGINNVKGAFNRVGNAVTRFFPDQFKKFGNFASRVGNNVAVRLGTGLPQIGQNIGKFIAGFGVNSAADKAMGFTKDDKDLMSGKTVKNKKRELANQAQQNISDKILQDRKDAKAALSTADKNVVSAANYEKLQQDLKNANNAGGGNFGNFVRFFTGGKTPQFLMSKDQKTQIKDTAKAPEVANLITNQNSMLQIRDDERNKVRDRVNKPFDDKITNLQTQKNAGIQKNIAGQQTADAAVDAATKAIDTKIVADTQTKNKQITGVRTADIERIEKDVGLREDTLLTETELLELFETLNLDTKKYTFKYLAEQLGFKKIK
jgi:Tfp pilus assembly major pilin PilA